MYIEGAAAHWYQSIENTTVTATWSSFCQALHERFDRDQHEALIRKLFHVKQTSTVSDYVERFFELIDHSKPILLPQIHYSIPCALSMACELILKL